VHTGLESCRIGYERSLLWKRITLERTLKAQTRCGDTIAGGSVAIVGGAVEEPPPERRKARKGLDCPSHCGRKNCSLR
jgi:hypothetical protein